MQFIAGILLSFGGLLSEIIQGGSPQLNLDNPGLVKVMGGFVFPVGLVMYAVFSPYRSAAYLGAVTFVVIRRTAGLMWVFQDCIGRL